MNAKCERTSMDLSKSMADKSCRISPIGAVGDALRVHALIPNCAQTGGFRPTIREVRNLGDWMVVQAEFELPAPFHQISRRVCSLFRAIQANPCEHRGFPPVIRPNYAT